MKELEIGSNSANSYRQLTQRNHQKAWSCVFREKKGKRRVGGGKGRKERRGGKRGGKRGGRGEGGEGRGRKEKGQMEAELREGWRLTTCCSVGLRWNSQRKGSPERFPLSMRVTPPSEVREEEREVEGGGEWR